MYYIRLVHVLCICVTGQNTWKILQKEKAKPQGKKYLILNKIYLKLRFVFNMKYLNYIRFPQYFLPRSSYQRNYIQQKIYQEAEIGQL